MRIELFPIVVAHNQAEQARLRRIRLAEAAQRQTRPSLLRRLFRRGRSA